MSTESIFAATSCERVPPATRETGGYSDYDEGRPSASEADMAFVKQLYYWCKGDQQLMDECFRASGRMRRKWDEQRGDQTYGEMTIQKVCRTNSETFRGRYVERG
jgi:Uncharacterized conserved protein